MFDWTVYKYQKNAQAVANATAGGTVSPTQEEEEKPTRHRATGTTGPRQSAAHINH